MQALNTKPSSSTQTQIDICQSSLAMASVSSSSLTALTQLCMLVMLVMMQDELNSVFCRDRIAA